MPSNIVIHRSDLLIALAVVAIILLFFRPKSLWTLVRWIIFIPTTYISIFLIRMIDPYELIAGVFLSKSSWFFELSGGIEEIAMDYAILTLLANFILPKTIDSRIIAVVGGGLVCLWNLYRYCTFSFMPMGWDPNEPHQINWLFNGIYFTIYATLSYVFCFPHKKGAPISFANKLPEEKADNKLQ